MMQHLSAPELAEMPSRKRAVFFNLLSGLQPAVLVTTTDRIGNENAAVFNSLTHIGSNPPLLALFFRPLTVERHTFENILSTQSYCINFLPASFANQVHASSAKYPSGVSEAEHLGLETERIEGVAAPVLKDASISLALKPKEQIDIKSNGALMLIGEVEWMRFPDHMVTEDGWFNWENLNPLLVGGLDHYFSAQSLNRFGYAEFGAEPKVLFRPQ